jgi:hypothetical protein
VPLDGPGTGIPLYRRHEPMRPDWENVVPTMVHLALSRQEVDRARIALVGRSFGGLRAPRGVRGQPHPGRGPNRTGLPETTAASAEDSPLTFTGNVSEARPPKRPPTMLPAEGRYRRQ